VRSLIINTPVNIQVEAYESNWLLERYPPGLLAKLKKVNLLSYDTLSAKEKINMATILLPIEEVSLSIFEVSCYIVSISCLNVSMYLEREIFDVAPNRGILQYSKMSVV